jgi:hypothetical protein
MTPLCFLDVETTGLHPGRLAWEVAMIRRDDEGQRMIQLFVDIDLAGADPFGLKIGGFYERHPHYAVDPKPAMPELFVRAWSEGDAAKEVELWTRGAHLIGAVPSFDAATLDPMLRRHGLIPAWHYHLIDVEALAVGYLCAHGKPVGPPWRSDDLSRACGVDPPGEADRHTALGDARWAVRLYDAITGGES